MSKYNNKKVELDGSIFDSEAESKYYELLKEKQGAGEIQAIELQASFVLQPGFKKNGKRFDAITYKTDFMIYLPNGDMEVINVKGVETDTFSIKKKMFEYKFLHLSLLLIGYKTRHKNRKMIYHFMDFEELKKMRKEAKRARKQK
ncbi:hypothetical protein BAQ48_20285 [Bacillus luti]|uniref:DUF1064 domain-containing protein n=1 Tax=Bacillus luti TaxID=2026191 RepID=UPI0008FE2B8D|nr:DUF1064 domain-containing protein [Bacillus luti]OJE47396.1 hypothetical protein BAQ48_20285 [Bacillus luti]